jgi:hypothetical protein
MGTIKDRAQSHLMAIEQIHGLKFLNREEIAELIAQSAADERQALLMCTAVNLWAAGNGVTGEAKIPEDLLQLQIANIQNHVFQRSSGKTGIMQDGQSKSKRAKKG